MNEDDIGRLVYLSLLLAAVGSWVFVQNRQSLGKTAQQLAIWALIFLGVIAGYGLWGDVQRTLLPRQTVSGDEIRIPRSDDGHFHLRAEINGTEVSFLVDTGATEIVLSRRDAQRIGVDLKTLRFTGRAYTANGEVRTARVTLEDVTIGPFRDQNVRAVVNEGDLNKSLLGMGYLQRWSEMSIRSDILYLRR